MADDDKSFSRKGFFGEIFGFVRKGVTSHVEQRLAKSLDAPLRPPGSLEELEFLSTCTRCNKCHDVCPHGAIMRFPLEAGVSANTPYIEPNTQACLLCPDTPCISVCEPGALKPTPIEKIQMGRALIQTEDCIAHDDKVCTRCYDACPLPEQAITFDDDFKPVIMSGCVGCGACQQQCPVYPVGVKVLSPLSYRAHVAKNDTYFGVFDAAEDEATEEQGS